MGVPLMALPKPSSRSPSGMVGWMPLMPKAPSVVAAVTHALCSSSSAEIRSPKRVSRMESATEETAALLSASPGPFSDERMAELLLHYAGRHATSSLEGPQREAWRAYRRRRLIDDPELASVQLPGYLARIEQLRAERPDCAGLLDELAAWPAHIGIDGL